MNLIGHFACAEAREPLVRVGSIVPDLLGLHRRKPRVDAIVRLWEADGRPAGDPEEGVAQMLEGIRFHHHVDVHFHRAPLFTEGARGLRVALEEACGAPGLKRFFAAHLLIELFFDHLLLREIPGRAEAFYRDLAAARLGALPAFALRHPEMEREPLLGFLDRVGAGGLVEDYRSLDGIFQRVERMLLHFRQRAMTREEQHAAAEFLNSRQAALRSELLLFIASMQQWVGAVAPAPLAARPVVDAAAPE